MGMSKFNSSGSSGRANKIVSAQEAIQLIRSGDTVATGGFAGIGFAEELAIEIEKSFLAGNPASPSN